jgi:peptide/nickel transport system substrate-binding protein
MFKQMKVALWLTALLVLAALAACQPQTQVVEVTRVVTKTITEEGQEVEVTRVVTEMQEVVVTSTPEAMAPMGRGRPDDVA